MISCEKYRSNIQITLSDIFADFNDNRKDMLMKRVKLALEDLEIRMRNQVENSNLANLQMLLKKQQTLKKMEEKIKEITDQIEEKRERDQYLNHKINQLQSQINKNYHSINPMQEKIKNLTETIHQKQAALSLKEDVINQMGKQLQTVQKQNQLLEAERQKLEDIIKKIREKFHHKSEETELILKIKEKKMEETMNESLTKLHITNLREKEKLEIQQRLKNPKIQKKHQKIQVSIPINPQTTSRSREPQTTARMPAKSTMDREIQTEATQQKKIIQFIDSSPKKQQKLEEIRLVYSTTPKYLPTIDEQPSPIEQPKITKFYACQTRQMTAQTDPVIFKPPTPNKLEQSCQVLVDDDSDFIKALARQIQALKDKYNKIQQFHDRRYWQLLKIYEQRPSQEQDLKEIELLKLSILELQLQLAKKDKEMTQQRQLFSKANHDLLENQNNILLKRLNVKLGDTAINKKTKFNQTCSFFRNSRSPQRIQTQLSQNHLEDIEYDSSEMLMTTFHTTKIKKGNTDEDIITVTKSKNSLKYRRHSLKTSMMGNEYPKDITKISRQYRKYTKQRNNNNPQ